MLGVPSRTRARLRAELAGAGRDGSDVEGPRSCGRKSEVRPSVLAGPRARAELEQVRRALAFRVLPRLLPALPGQERPQETSRVEKGAFAGVSREPTRGATVITTRTSALRMLPPPALNRVRSSRGARGPSRPTASPGEAACGVELTEMALFQIRDVAVTA